MFFNIPMLSKSSNFSFDKQKKLPYAFHKVDGLTKSTPHS